MVLKRLLVTTLGALGLGALAAGTASGQTAGEGNIPAPNIFDDQITCSMLVPTPKGVNLPSTVPMGGMTSPLDDIIGMGTNLLTADDTTLAALTDGPAKLAGLGYVIPSSGMNCGLGAGMGPTLGTMNIDANDDGDFVDVGDTLAWGSVPKDVADGYTALEALFIDVYGNPEGTTGGTARALQAAQKAVNDAVAAGTTGPSLTSLQTTLTQAQEAHNKAMAKFNAASAGPIYQAGVAEWMAKAAVTKSIADYNTQVGKTNMAKTALDEMLYREYTYTGDGTAGRPFVRTEGASKYVPLTNGSLVGTVVTIADGMGTVVTSALEAYAGGTAAAPVAGMAAMAATGVGTATAMAATSSDSSTSNFTALGELIVPMTAVDLDGDAASFLEALTPTVTATSAVGTNDVAFIRTTVENVRIAAAALKKARDENTNPRFQPLYDEAYRRANLEQNYYDALWARVLADNTDTRTVAQLLRYTDTDGNGINEASEQTAANINEDYQASPITIASRNAGYTTESNKRFTAEQDLRSKVAAREMATADVRAQFNGAQTFYEQLVARRMALKATADKAVADATTPTAAQTKAAADAQKSLDAANKAKADLDALFADDDNPTVALMTELLKTGGNDGQALVDAISSNYDTANEAKTKADEVAESVSGLTGDEGAVSMNTTRSMQNEDDIEALDGRVSMNEGEIWDDDGNSRIDMNETRSMENRTMITMNTENIATNAANIMTNTMEIGYGEDGMSRIDHNEARSMQNATDIMTNAGHIMENRGMIEMNASGVSSNADAIAANMNSIGQNSSAISDNRNMIGELSEDLDVVRAGVAASMALAGMPAINGRGISIGVGSFDGESAFAVGFQIQGDMASFKVGVTSASGATGASAGVGFQF